MSKPTTKVDAEKLLASMSGKPTSDSVKKALESLKEQQNKEQQEKLIEQLSLAQTVVSASVASLRRIRQQEKEAKDLVVALETARQQFHADGDYDAFKKAVKAAAPNMYYSFL